MVNLESFELVDPVTASSKLQHRLEFLQLAHNVQRFVFEPRTVCVSCKRGASAT